MTGPESVLVVGASASGLATAEALRRFGYAGRLTLLGAEPHVPYDRPPLSKQVLAGAWEPARADLRPATALTELGAELLLGDRAVSLDAPTRVVTTESGRSMAADAVVVATGSRPRHLPGTERLRGVHVLRTLDDALALRGELASSSRLVVVGEGVLGAEVAATAHGLGCRVTLAGPGPAPMADHLGPLVSGLLRRLHEEHGVRLELGRPVRELTAERGRVSGVGLADGERVAADVVVVAVGAVPATDWLHDSGLTLDDGVVCDSGCRAAPGVYAVGDVARWHHPGLGTPLRLENRTNATESAQVAAANLLGADREYAPVPHFWTDQFDTRIQVFGLPTGQDEATVVEGDLTDRRFVVRFQRDDRVTGVIGWRMPKQARLRSREVGDALSPTATT